MVIRTPDPGDIEKFNRINKLIDPIREVMFEIVVADELVSLNEWDKAKRHLDRARIWLDKAKYTAALDQYYIIKLQNILAKLYELLREKNFGVWNDEMDYIMPDVINTVFLAFLVAAHE
jgi:hypothetical protein